MVVSLSFYGMSTFEGPMMSIKTVNALCRTTPTGPSATCTPRARLGRDGLGRHHVPPGPAPLRPDQACGARALIDWHFWTTTIGIVLYVASMWIAGVMQGLMPRQCRRHADHTFVETAEGDPRTTRCAIGGTWVWSGMFLMMVYNVAIPSHRPRQRSPAWRAVKAAA